MSITQDRSAPKLPDRTPATSRKATGPQPRTRFGTWLQRPLASFHLIVTIATLLTLLGLVMVLSASSVEAYAGGGNAYTLFAQQAMYAALGAILFYVALRLPIRTLRKLSFPLFVVSVVALFLVLIPGIGVEAQGARRWFMLGPISVQPSEIAKVTLALWGAHLLASRRAERAHLKELLIPLVPAGVVVCLLVVLQPNLSTTIALGIILAALLWFGGLPVRLFVTILATGIGAAIILALSAGYRSARISAYLDRGADPQGKGYQARQAMYSLADGGIWGRGLGQSRAKWSYLPNSHNDFIFAIIGEELGFIGCCLVIGLFALFVYAGLRISMRSVDPFLRLLTAASTSWIVAQAFINIGYVVGLLPVTGLQLPLVSAGGSSLAITLLMFGIIANAARHEPEAIAALHAGQDGRFSRLLRLPKPESYSPTKAAASRSEAARRAAARAARQRVDRASAPRVDKKKQGASRRTADPRRATDPGRGNVPSRHEPPRRRAAEGRVPRSQQDRRGGERGFPW